MPIYVVTTTDDTSEEVFGRHVFTSVFAARNFADDAKARTDTNYIVVRMETIYNTQTIDEALNKVFAYKHKG